MNKYAPTTHDPGDDRKPWAIMMPNDNGSYYLASDVDARIEKLEEALQRIAQWADAYPLDVFPEPDFKRVAQVLKDNGLSLDQVSASNMRHVVTGVGKIAKSGL